MQNSSIISFFLIFTFFLSARNVQAQGEIDPSFNIGTGANNTVWSTNLQPDGKVLVGGNQTTYNGMTVTRIIRLNADGSVDATFNPGGSGPTGGSPSAVLATPLQPDGKIMIGGTFNLYNGTTRNRIARLNADGTLDSTFDPGAGPSGSGVKVWDIAIQPDGKYIVVGKFTSYDGTPANNIVRVNTDGSLDPTFNIGSGANNFVRRAVIQPDGKIIIMGGFTSYNGTTRNRIARLNTDGSLDATFNPGSGASSAVYDAALQPDGKMIIVGGFTNYNGSTQKRIVRVNADGTVDATFNPGGTGCSSGTLRTIAMQPDGKVVIGGNSIDYNGTARRFIARVNADGSLDTAFDPGTGLSSVPRTITLQPDEKIIIGGQFQTYNGISAKRIARLWGTPPPPPVWTGITSSDWDDPTNWSTGVPTATGSAVIPTNPVGSFWPITNTATAEVGDITIQNSAILTVSSGNALTVNGVLENNGVLRVQDAGSLVQATGSTLSGSGQFQVQRNGSSTYDYWSSPIGTYSAAGLPGSYQYEPSLGTDDPSDDEFDPGWIAASGNLTVGRGYAAFGILSKSFNGTVNNGNVTVGVEYNGLPNVAWNLIGNPYPGGVTISQFLTTNSSKLDVPAVYLWDDPGTFNYGVGDYAVRNAAGGTAGGGGNTPGPVLGTAQGFKVKVNASATTIDFNNAMRSTGNNSMLFRHSSSKRLWLNITHPEGFFNQTLVGFFEDGTAGIGIYDAPKLNWMSDLSLYSLLNDEPYSIQGYGPFYPEAVFPIGIHTGALNGMDITFEIDHVDGLENNDIYLEDAYLGEFHDLNSGAYTFTATQGVTNDRFFIHFSPQSVTSIAETEGLASFGAVMNNETLVVSSQGDLEGDIEVLDMSGRVIYTKGNVQLNSEGTRINLSNLKNGVYIVRLLSSEGAYSKQIIK